MSIRTTNRNTWSLTLLRDGKDAQTQEIEQAKFRYGRHSEELQESTPLPIPDALITLLRHSEIESEAIESGFVVEMCLFQQADLDGWAPFTLVTESRFTFSGEWSLRRPRGLYAGPFNGCSFELVNCSSPCEPKELPKTIWIRVIELPIQTLAWSFNRGIFDESSPRQMTLDSWTKNPINSESRFSRNDLALPGQSGKHREFLW